MLSLVERHLAILGGASMKSGGFSEVETVRIEVSQAVCIKSLLHRARYSQKKTHHAT